MSLLERHSLSQFPHLTKPAKFLSGDLNRFFTGANFVDSRPNEFQTDWEPSLDIEQKNNMYLVRVDLPGVDPQEIKLTIENNLLIIEGKRDTKIEEHKESIRHAERTYGNFYRAINLPFASQGKGIEAYCKNGVLEVVVPFQPSFGKQKIAVIAD